MTGLEITVAIAAVALPAHMMRRVWRHHQDRQRTRRLAVLAQYGDPDLSPSACQWGGTW